MKKMCTVKIAYLPHYKLQYEMNICIIDFHISEVEVWVKGEMHKGQLKISEESMVKHF